LQGLTDDLKRPPDTLEDLKFVLRVIADIRDKSLDVELRYVDLQERYRTLRMYDIEVGGETIPSLTQDKCDGYINWRRNFLVVHTLCLFQAHAQRGPEMFRHLTMYLLTHS